MKQDVELQELRRRSGEVPVEVHQLQEENALLARRGAQILEEAAQLSSKRGSLEEQQQQKVLEVQQLQQEKDSVRQQVDAAHSREAAARNVQESALKALDLERRRSQDLAKTLKAALQQRHLAAEEAEKKAMDAEREVANLEADSVGHSQVVEAEHVAEAESLRRQQKVEYLELELEQVQSQRSEEAEELQQRQRKDRAAFVARETQQKLMQARVEARRLEDAAQQLAKQLAESEQKAEESDRKAMAVAKELAETSRSLQLLRAELHAAAPLRKDLEVAQKEAGALQQRLASRSASERSPLEEERALKEALRNAWENEALERQQTEEKLLRADAFWRRLLEQLQSLQSLAHRCRTDAAGAPLPTLPDLSWDGAQVAGSMKALVNFFESLAQLHGEVGGRVPSLSASPARSHGRAWR